MRGSRGPRSDAILLLVALLLVMLLVGAPLGMVPKVVPVPRPGLIPTVGPVPGAGADAGAYWSGTLALVALGCTLPAALLEG